MEELDVVVGIDAERARHRIVREAVQQVRDRTLQRGAVRVVECRNATVRIWLELVRARASLEKSEFLDGI